MGKKRNGNAGRNNKKGKTKGNLKQPHAQTKRKEAETIKNSPMDMGGGPGDTPKTSSQTKTENANDKAQQSSYLVGFLITVRHLFNRCLRKLDEHQGGITAIATVVIAILTWVYVSYSKRQWRTMEGQLTEMRKDQRAWLFATEGSRPDLTVGKSLPAIVKLTNTGKTPAVEVRSNIYVELVKNGGSPHFEGQGMRSIAETGLILPNTVPEFQGFPLSANRWRYKPGGKPHEGELDILNQGEFDSVARGDYWVALHGIIRYKDAFHSEHWTKFCFWSNPLKVGSYSAFSCTQYNSIDED